MIQNNLDPQGAERPLELVVYGGLGLAMRRITWQRASQAAGRAGLIFLPMALLVMQINWNGIFWNEPRFRTPFGGNPILFYWAGDPAYNRCHTPGAGVV